MQYSRQFVVETLRHAGLPELADKASQVLPELVDPDQLEAWGIQHGLSRDELISRLGGSS